MCVCLLFTVAPVLIIAVTVGFALLLLVIVVVIVSILRSVCCSLITTDCSGELFTPHKFNFDWCSIIDPAGELTALSQTPIWIELGLLLRKGKMGEGVNGRDPKVWFTPP